VIVVIEAAYESSRKGEVVRLVRP